MTDISMSNNVMFIMKDDGEVFSANECFLTYKGGQLNLIEWNGLYAYSEFFMEGIWPDEYYDEGEKSDQYDGIRLKMLSGKWYNNMNDLIGAIKTGYKHVEDIEYIEDSTFDKKMSVAIDALKKMREIDEKCVEKIDEEDEEDEEEDDEEYEYKQDKIYKISFE